MSVLSTPKGVHVQTLEKGMLVIKCNIIKIGKCQLANIRLGERANERPYSHSVQTMWLAVEKTVFHAKNWHAVLNKMTSPTTKTARKTLADAILSGDRSSASRVLKFYSLRSKIDDPTLY